MYILAPLLACVSFSPVLFFFYCGNEFKTVFATVARSAPISKRPHWHVCCCFFVCGFFYCSCLGPCRPGPSGGRTLGRKAPLAAPASGPQRRIRGGFRQRPSFRAGAAGAARAAGKGYVCIYGVANLLGIHLLLKTQLEPTCQSFSINHTHTSTLQHTHTHTYPVPTHTCLLPP